MVFKHEEVMTYCKKFIYRLNSKLNKIGAKFSDWVISFTYSISQNFHSVYGM